MTAQCKWVSCMDKFTTTKELYNHYLGTHIGPQQEDALKSCKWNECTYVAKTQHQLKSHGFKHIPYKQYECSVCSKQFKWKHDRNKHTSAVHRNKFQPGPITMMNSNYITIVPSPMSPVPSEVGLYSPMSMMSGSPLSSYYQHQEGFEFNGYQSTFSDTGSQISQVSYVESLEPRKPIDNVVALSQPTPNYSDEPFEFFK